MESELALDEVSKQQKKGQSHLISNPQFWSIVSIFILMTLHHYDNLTSFSAFSAPDLPLGITRHTIDRILFLVPVILSSFIFGSKGGKIALVFAFIIMLPRALFISAYPLTALWETVLITLIGSIAPLGIDHYKKQQLQLEVTRERLVSTEKELHTRVQLSIEQQRQLSVINTFSAMLSQSLELNHVTKVAVDMIIDVMQVEVVLIFALTEDKKLKVIAHRGIKEESTSFLNNIELNNDLLNKIAKLEESYMNEEIIEDLIDDFGLDFKFCSSFLEGENILGELSVPMVAQGKTIGIVCVGSRSERKFQEPDLMILSALANLTGIAMHNAHLYQEREIATNKLKLSEKKYRKLFENAHDAIWVQDLSGKITAANQAAADLFGCSLTDLVGSDSKQFYSHDEFLASTAIQKEILNGIGNHQPYRRKIQKKDGTEAIVMLTTNLITTAGSPDGFQFIGRDITKEVRMQENQRFYLKQITKGHEEERQRISRDLHDSTTQNLIAILRQLEKFCEENTRLSETKLNFLWNLHAQIKSTLHEVRQLSRDLRPSVLDNLGLLPAVEWLTEQMKTENNVETKLTVIGKERRFSQEIEISLFRIIQEALRNIAKHAEATMAQVIIELKDHETRVTITDNGKGFELPENIGELSRRGKLGIDGMQTRARLAGGTFDIQSAPGKGTVINVTIPE
ncbi:MAG: PAS domain S-box protein [Actinomycetota bacterium]